MTGFDVGIVGAGINGASAAFHLGRAGVRTVIFERDTPAAGPTGRSSAICRSVYTNQFLARTAHESIGMFERFAELVGDDAGFERTGMLYLFPPAHRDAAFELGAGLRSLGIDVSTLDAGALAAEHPELAVDGTVALWEQGAGHADPARTTRALFEDAVRHGVEPRLRTAVTGIDPRPGGGAVLATADGANVACDRVLIAAGPWTRPLAAAAGARLPLHVERHIVALFGWGEAPPVPYIINDVSGGYYMKPEGRDQFGLGTLLSEPEADPDAFQEFVGADEALALAEPTVARIPGLARAAFVGGWASVYDVSPDWQPVIGEIADGIYVSAGTSGHGFKLAPALARHVAGLVTGTDHDAALGEFTPSRFETGAPLGAGFGDARIIG
jgi:sarcosine oxidase, subunit beta